MNEEDIKSRSGFDAYVYLKFSKSLIVLIAMYMLFGFIVLIPIYATSGKLIDFARYTGKKKICDPIMFPFFF